MLEIVGHYQRQFAKGGPTLRFGQCIFPSSPGIDSKNGTGYFELTVPDAIEAF
ncbi:hypothetical protein [Bradyrhizobium sp. BR 1432]|uniref:hypothetical protein n=1 Tax=Bradyrhizobium sp. BR 1432 TaxID=3447966 RepID=UPI003EE7E469